ncbi:MAG: pyridoxal phosphate-dependent decarboxylase family protein [Sphingomonas sp.]
MQDKLAIDRAHHHATEYLRGLSVSPVRATTTLDELRQRLWLDLPSHGTDAPDIIDDLVEATRGGHLGSAGGRFFAWVIGGALPSALAADWLASTWDNNAALYACGPASAVVEEVAGAWVKQLLQLPEAASFAFTTGCQMAHVTCLAAARHALLRDIGWDVEARGLWGAPPLRILATEQRHGSIERAARFLGFGTDSIVPLATDETSRLRRRDLETALRNGGGPTIVVLDAGDLNIGAIDPFDELIPVARAAGAWVHVDGAFGLWARASDRHGAKLIGVEQADSWATDAHKWLNTPQDNGIAIVRDVDAHRAAMSVTAAYLSSPGGVRDQIDWTPDWTRRARGFAVYAAIRELGRSGVADLVDRCCDHAAELADGFAAMPGVDVVARPTLNQALVRFLHPGNEATDRDHDAWTDHLIAAMNVEGTAFFSGSVWRGRRVMRISVVNWRTSKADVGATLAAAARVLDAERSAVGARRS